jgi:ubiquinone/menaquinone biosynthesis C-methylase UbiE
MKIDYNDCVASTYDQRYAHDDTADLESVLAAFVTDCEVVAEIGCGTGHWLMHAQTAGARRVIGVDASPAMLAKARRAAPGAGLVRGTAERLPLADASLDRVFCVNAHHHFPDLDEFIREVRRVLRPGGEFVTIALDPHTGTDQWWIYDYFASTRDADRRRYPSTARIRSLLDAAAFEHVTTSVGQHIPAAVSFSEAVERGLLDRASTSQLMVISDVEFAHGLRTLHAERPMLTADLRLYATSGRVPDIG